MKNLYKYLKCLMVIISLGISPSVTGQDSKYGFLNLVNLVPGDKTCKISIGGKDVIEEGLAASRATGWFAAPIGAAPMDLKIEGYDKASGNIDIVENQSSVIVIFLERIRGTDKDGKPLPPKIRIKRCDALPVPETGFQLKAMSFFPDENRFQIGQQSLNLKLFEGADIPKWAGGGLKVMHNQKLVGSTPQILEKGPYYLFMGTDHEDKFTCVLVDAEAPDLPPWMKKKESKP